MNNLKRDLIEAIVLGLIIGAIGILGIVQYQQTKANDIATIGAILSLRNEVNDVKDEVIHSEDFNQFMFTLMNTTDNIIIKTQQALNKKIDNLLEKTKYDKFKLEKTLQQYSVIIHNNTLGALGTGVTLKYKGKFYILSAGHMATVSKDNFNLPEELELWENGNKICELEIVKHNYTSPEENKKGDLTKGTDLLLLKPKNANFIPRFYVELADFEPDTATEIYIVGNPMGLEDVVSDGRIILYKNNFVYYIDHTYFGNSGGGVFTKDGKLIGIVSHMIPLQPLENIPAYMVYGAVRLSVIYTFLADI